MHKKKKRYKRFINSINEILNTEVFKWVYINEEKTSYLISSLGKLYTTNYIGKTHKFVEIKPNRRKDGYYAVGIHHKGYTYMIMLHILVAEAFIPNPDQLPVVNHIDGDKHNNNYTNLEWVTHKENSVHAANMGLLPTGEKSRLARISNKVANQICKEFEKNKLSFIDIASKYGTTYNTIYDIYRRKSWKQVSSNYDFSLYNRDGRFLKNQKK